MSKHTPGPWKAEIAEYPSIYAPDLHNAWIAFTARVRSPEERQANAHLLAAAPDMAEALQAAMDLIDAIGDEACDRLGYTPLHDDPRHQQIENAIAKAGGR